MAARNPGRTGRPWRRIRADVLATEDHCWICGHAVDLTLPGTHPYGPTADHVIPLSHGGDPRDRSNLRLAHLRCNGGRGNHNPHRRRTSRPW